MAGGLEVARGVEGGRDEDLVVLSVRVRREGVRHKHEALQHGAEQLDAGCALRLGVVRLNRRADGSHKLASRRNHVRVRHSGHVDVALAADLLLGDDDLRRLAVLGVGHGVVEDAHDAHDAASVAHLVREVRGVTNDELGLGDLALRLHADGLAVLHNDLVDGLVQHVGASVDGAQPSECLGELSEAVERVEVGRLQVARQRLEVKLHLGQGRASRLLQVVVVEVEGQSVAGEVDGAVVEAELLEDLVHGGLGGVEALAGGALLPAGDVLEELLEAALLEQAHEAGAEGLLLGGRHLRDLVLLHHVAAVDHLEVEVLGHVRLDEHAHENTVGHDELGDYVDVIVAARAEGRGRGLVDAAGLLEEQLQVQGGRLSAVVVVPVHVEDLHALSGENSGKDALLEAGAEHNRIIAFIHVVGV
mmetsp:Transcript_14426/g.56731  ORF Transcript_14426/g.56731 Transcript_14426/m.56731 type:complete len:418 (-) Transcript_14426:163-1416(-)